MPFDFPIPGDEIVVNGWGLGENHWGGLAQKARLDARWLLRLPAPYALWHAMAIGTAGYTAALCVMALQRHGLKPSDGEVLVTGATGGVGSVTVRLLAGLGYQVTAATGRPHEAEYLKGLGAIELVARDTLAAPGKPLQRERWAGVVDVVGSHTLANACAGTRWNGAVAACGLAQGHDFPSTVMPFILRGVTLYTARSGLATARAAPARGIAGSDEHRDRVVRCDRAIVSAARRPPARAHGRERRPLMRVRRR